MLANLRETGLDTLLVEAARARLWLATASEPFSGIKSQRQIKRLLTRAEEQSSLGLLYAAVTSGSFRQVNPQLKEALSGRYAQQLAHNQYVIRELGRVLDCLVEVDVLVVKGLALAGALYHDLGIRPTADIDLLVRHNDLPVLTDALGSLGYKPKPDFAEKVALYCHAAFEREHKPGVIIEAHWSLGRNFPSDAEDALLWQDTRDLEIGPIKCRSLSVENHLMQATLHLAHHSVFGWHPSLLWLTDVALLSRQSGLQWALIAQAARRQRFGRAVYLALSLSERLLEGRFPQEVRGELIEDAGTVALLADRGLLDALPLRGLPTPLRHMLAASFQGSTVKRGRYLGKHWVKPVLKVVGLKRDRKGEKETQT